MISRKTIDVTQMNGRRTSSSSQFQPDMGSAGLLPVVLKSSQNIISSDCSKAPKMLSRLHIMRPADARSALALLPLLPQAVSLNIMYVGCISIH